MEQALSTGTRRSRGGRRVAVRGQRAGRGQRDRGRTSSVAPGA